MKYEADHTGDVSVLVVYVYCTILYMYYIYIRILYNEYIII